MASFAMRRTLRTYFRAVVVSAAIAASPVVCAQAAPDATTPDAEHLVAEIQAEQSRNGPHSARLIDLLRALRRSYRDAGDRRLATAATERALELVRVSSGFASLDQAPLLRELLEDDDARGDTASAGDREQALLALAAKNPRDLRTVAIYRELADRKMDLHRRFVAGEYAPEIEPPFVAHYTQESLLGQAWNGYWNAISVLRENGQYSSDELRDLEMTIVRSAYQAGGAPRESSQWNYYEVGKRSYQRLLADAVEGARPPADRALAVVEMADWELLFSRYSAALELYETAHAELEEQAPGDTSIDRLFAPRIPVVLPTFLANPLASKPTAESAPHIDVAFDVDRYGFSRRVDVVEASAAVSVDAKRELVQSIERSRFRPSFADGKIAHRSRVVVRYFVSGTGSEP